MDAEWHMRVLKGQTGVSCAARGTWWVRRRWHGSPRAAAAVVFLLFSVAFSADRVAAAHLKPFWHDEIFTILLARLESIGLMWKAALDGVDFMPPLNGFLTHAIHRLAGDGPIITRTPAAVGVWLACLAVFLIVRRRSNLPLALASATLMGWTPAFRYGVEARGYGLMLGCASISLLVWSEATGPGRKRWHLPALAVSLTGGVWCHYYGALNVAALSAAELVRDVRRRRFDAGIWAAFAAAAIGALPLLPAVHAAAAHAGRSWTLVNPPSAPESYTFLFRRLLKPWPLATAAALAALGWLERLVAAPPPRVRPIPLHEGAAAIAFLLIPLAGVGARAGGMGVFTPRYALSAVVAFCAAVPLVLWVASGRSRLTAFGLAACLSFSLAHSAWDAPSVLRQPAPDPLASRPLLVAALQHNDSVCVTSALTYLQYWYYAPPALSPRLCYLADPAAARRLTGSDSMDEGVLNLRRWSAISVHDYDLFVANHAVFTVYGAGSGWLLQRLAEAGADVRETGAEAGFSIYQVSMPGR